MSSASLWWLAALLAPAAIVGLALTWRRLAAATPAQRVTLLVLRAAAVTALALMVVNPTAERRTTVEQQPRVVVLVDRSASMGVKDAPGGRERLAWAAGLIRPGAPLTRALARAEVATLLFADDVRPASLPLSATADGPATDPHAALAAAMELRAGGKPDAIVLVTDGAANRGPSRDELTAWVERRRTPLYCVGVGSARRPSDAWLARIDAPRSIRAGSVAAVSVRVGAHGFGGMTASVSLQAEGIGSDRKGAPLGDESGARLAFSLRPGKPGVYRATLQLAPLPGEWTAANNSRTFFLRVTPGASKLLFLAGRPGREFKFIRRVLDSVPDLRVTYLIRESPQAFRREGSAAAAARLPTGDALSSNDAVILADVPARAFSAAELQRLADFVRVRGGGLGMLGGPEAFGAGGYGGSPPAAALGVILIEGKAAYSPLAAKAQPTPAARTLSPTLEIERQDGFPGWAALPFLAGLNTVGGVKPGATALLQSGQGAPLLVVQRYGAGRTLSWLTDSTYRWVLSKDATPDSRRGHAIFWSGVAAWLTTPPNRAPVALETDRDIYESGDTARVIAQVSDAGFQPVARAEVTVEVSGRQGAPTRLRLTETPGAPGRYEAGLLVGPPGRYLLRARAALGGRALGTDTREVAAEAPRRELADPAQNVPLLQALAQASGGLYVPAERAAQLDRLPGLQPLRRTVRTHDAWARGAPAFLIVLVLIGLDWFLRRWWGVG